jgi:hypothetical protein
MLTPEMIKELHQLEIGGKLHTKHVVALAKKPSSALHKHPAFEWDVKKAAYQQWMDAARSIVQVYVGVVEDHGKGKMMRQYVSIVDAKEGTQVYRSTQKVLLQNRSVIVSIVADRILSIIASYPLSEFDEVVELVKQIRNNSTEGGAEAA